MPRLLLALAAVLSLTACDSQEPERPGFGRFEATITGDLDRDLEGNASFTIFPGFEDARVLTVNLTTSQVASELGRFVSLSDYEGRIDGPGTYDLGDNRLEAPSLLYFDEGSDFNGVWTATEGTLRIARLEDDRIEGDLEAVLERSDLETGTPAGRAVLEAEFEAVTLGFRGR